MNRDDLPLRYIIGAAIGVILGPIVLYWKDGEAGLQVASVVISGLLTLALVVLYYQQYSVQNEQTNLMEKQQAVQERQTDIMGQQQTIHEKQAELMERDYESSVARIGQITAKEDYIYIILKNGGRGTIQQMYLRSEIVSNTGSLEIEPGVSQVSAAEGQDSTLPAFSPPKKFKAKVNFTQPRESGKKSVLSFRYFANSLGQEGVEECTIRLTLEIIDENTRSDEDVIEFEIAEQEVTTSEIVEREVSSKEGESNTFAIPQKTQLEDAIKLKQPQDILPHDFEERIGR